MNRLKHRLLPLLAAAALSGLVAWTALAPLAGHVATSNPPPAADSPLSRDLDQAVAGIDRLFEHRWSNQHLTPAAPAAEMQVWRRVSLALAGTIPSLAEIRAFEADQQPDRLQRWTARLLEDRRFGEYFAQRLAVAWLGSRQPDPPWFNRYRFEGWLAEQLLAGRPYDQLVREMVAAEGPPTTTPAADFISAEIVEGEVSANRLAARAVRAFLGQRIDCAECHDHPFDQWRQADFQGLAAYFAQVRTGSPGLFDDKAIVHEVEDRDTFARRVVEPCVPFNAAWQGKADAPRQRLADWITHPKNRRFGRAIANRVWGLMFGRPLVSPVDAIGDPSDAALPGTAAGRRQPGDGSGETELLDLLADDLAGHGGDLRRLAMVIASSRPFRLASTHAALSTPGGERYQREWAVFPLVRLRPEQLGRSLMQAASTTALSLDANLVTRIHRELWVRKFTDEHGLLGENEFDDRTATIPQTVQQMQGRFTREKSRADPASAAGRIASMAGDGGTCLEACYLVCLARRPTIAEQRHFLPQLGRAGSRQRRLKVEDIFWTLFNSPEFTWNH